MWIFRPPAKGNVPLQVVEMATISRQLAGAARTGRHFSLVMVTGPSVAVPCRYPVLNIPMRSRPVGIGG